MNKKFKIWINKSGFHLHLNFRTWNNLTLGWNWSFVVDNKSRPDKLEADNKISLLLQDEINTLCVAQDN